MLGDQKCVLHNCGWVFCFPTKKNFGNYCKHALRRQVGSELFDYPTQNLRKNEKTKMENKK